MQYDLSVKGKYQHCRDLNKQPIFVNSDGKNIVLKDELKPFWRTFCEETKGNQYKVNAFID